jgi:hypothetical protein
MMHYAENFAKFAAYRKRFGSSMPGDRPQTKVPVIVLELDSQVKQTFPEFFRR